MPEFFRITSRQNPRVKAAARLRTARERRQRGQFIIDGAREIGRAIAAGILPVEAFICDELADSPECLATLKVLAAGPADLFRVTSDVYAKLAYGNRHDGVIVVAQTPSRILSELRLPANPLVAIIEGVEKPGNLGAILRSADAAGVDAVVVVDGGTDIYNANTVRASLGTVFRSNVCPASTRETTEWLRASGLQVVVARPDALRLYTEIDMRGGVAIALGSEARGLSNAWDVAGAVAVRLPMHGIADSLNVSTTAAVLFYEALRQRDKR